MLANPRISILIATDDHPPDLHRFFDILVKQTLPPDEYEIVLIDIDRSQAYKLAANQVRAGMDPRLRLHYQEVERASRASALNLGLRHCRAPIVLLLGDDAIASAGFAEAHLRFHLQHPEPYRVGIGALLVPERLRTRFTDWMERSGHLFGAPMSADMTTVPESFFYAANGSVKRDFLLAAGPFDERFAHHAWDDYDLGLRLQALGMKSGFVPGADCEHDHDIPMSERCRLLGLAGESTHVIEAKHGRDFVGRKRWLPPWCLRLCGHLALVGHLMSRSEQLLTAHYRAHLAAAFAEGYRRRTPRQQ